MRDLFRPWQRKVGCGLLVLASAVLGLWMRSRIYGDFITLDRDDSGRQFVASFQGSLKWILSRKVVLPVVKSGPGEGSGGEELDESNLIMWGIPDPDDILPPWYAFSLPTRYQTDETLMPIFGGTEYDWRWKRQTLGFLAAEARIGDRQVSIWMIPHWALTLVLSLLSAALMLWPRRQRPAEPGAQTRDGTR
jgi:hypothetical protein